MTYKIYEGSKLIREVDNLDLAKTIVVNELVFGDIEYNSLLDIYQIDNISIVGEE